MTFDEELSSVLEGETVDALGRGDHGHSRRDGLEQATPGRRAKALGSHGHRRSPQEADRKSTRLNSSHLVISYAVFCLKKKKNTFSTDTLKQKKQTRQH